MRPNRRQFGATAVRLASVTAAAATACALWAGTASAATASVTRHSTTTTISISPKSADSASYVTFSARVRSSGGARARGTVTFKWRDESLCTGRLAYGATHCRVLVAGIGRFAIRGFYSGNATHKPSVSGRAYLSIHRAPTATKITNAPGGTVVSGGAFTFHVSVSSPPGVLAPFGTAVVSPTSPTGLPFSKYGCDANIVRGKGSCTIHPPAYGIISYKATFQGNPVWKGSTYAGPYDLAVQNATTTTIAATSTTAGAVTLTATVYAMGADITGGTGTVAFYIGTSAGTVEPVTGCAAELLTAFDTTTGDNTVTCTGNADLDGLPAGNYYISAVYSGDPVNEGSNSNPPTEITVG
jgi:hypothetical protein